MFKMKGEMSISKENIPEVIRIKNFKELGIYKKAMILSDEVYDVVKRLPKEEEYGIKSQMRRAVTSISANIAEGQSQVFIKKEFTFCNTALGSAGEMRCWYEHCLRKGYIDNENYKRLDEMTVEIMKMIVGYMKRLSNEVRVTSQK